MRLFRAGVSATSLEKGQTSEDFKRLPRGDSKG